MSTRGCCGCPILVGQGCVVGGERPSRSAVQGRGGRQDGEVEAMGAEDTGESQSASPEAVNDGIYIRWLLLIAL